jgi:hypothetical protein
VAIFLDVCWRLLLAGLFTAGLILAASPWVQVDLRARLPDDPQFEGSACSQTPLQIARGQLGLPVDPGRTSHLFTVLCQRDHVIEPRGVWLMGVYPFSLMIGLFAAVFVSWSRVRPRVLLGLALFPILVLALQGLLGFPAAGWAAEQNTSLAKIEDFEESPHLSVSWSSAPTTSLVLLAIAALIAAAGFWLPKPDYSATPEPTPEPTPTSTPEPTPTPTPTPEPTPTPTEGSPT